MTNIYDLMAIVVIAAFSAFAIFLQSKNNRINK
jgi:hypothetical protein